MRLIQFISLAGCVVLLVSFSSKSKKEIDTKQIFSDSIIQIRAKFIKVSMSPCLCYDAIKERNLFELQESAPGIQVYTGKQIEIEYGFDSMNFKEGSSYYIKAKRIPNREYYKSLYTSKFPSRDWYLRSSEN